MSPPPSEVPYGTLDLMVLKTLQVMGPLHGYGIARRIEQMAEGALALNQGTIYPALLRLEQKGWIASEWGTSETNRRARFYSITRAGRKQLAAEADAWARTEAISIWTMTFARIWTFSPRSTSAVVFRPKMRMRRRGARSAALSR